MKPITRKEFIRECVNSYIKNNPEEYVKFLEQTRVRRAKLIDPKFAQLRNDNTGKIDEDTFRVALSVPDKLFGALAILNSDDYGPFGEKEGEMQWFAKEFPQFLLPQKF